MSREMSSSIVLCWDEGSVPSARFCWTSRVRVKISDWVCFMISPAMPVCIFRLCCSVWYPGSLFTNSRSSDVLFATCRLS